MRRRVENRVNNGEDARVCVSLCVYIRAVYCEILNKNRRYFEVSRRETRGEF